MYIAFMASLHLNIYSNPLWLVAGKDRQWYAFPYGPVFFILYSTEHPFTPGSEQYEFILQVQQWIFFANLEASVPACILLSTAAATGISLSFGYPLGTVSGPAWSCFAWIRIWMQTRLLMPQLTSLFQGQG